MTFKWFEIALYNLWGRCCRWEVAAMGEIFNPLFSRNTQEVDLKLLGLHCVTFLQCSFMFLSEAIGRHRHYVFYLSICLSIHLFIRHQTCEHEILKTNESVTVQIGTSGLRGKCVKRSTYKARRLKVNITQGQNRSQNSSQQYISRTVWWLLTKLGRHKCRDAKRQR